MKLNPHSPLPLYRQVCDDLLRRIRARRMAAGAQLMSEREMCRHYGVSRITVKQALADLIRRGLLVTAPGKGIFVREPEQLIVEGGPEGFVGQMQRLERAGEIRLIHKRLVPADAALAKHLHIRPGDPVIEIKRVKIIETIPAFIEHRWIPRALCPTLLEGDLAVQSLTDIARRVYRLNVGGVELTVRPARALAADAAVLQLRPGALVLRIEETGFLKDGTLIKWEQRIHRTGLNISNRISNSLIGRERCRRN